MCIINIERGGIELEVDGLLCLQSDELEFLHIFSAIIKVPYYVLWTCYIMFVKLYY